MDKLKFMMKYFFVTWFLILLATPGFSQDTKVTVINDTTELQEYTAGEKLKVNFRLNGKILTIKEKNKLLNEYSGIPQEFNIKNVDNEIIGEISFLSDDI